MTETARNIAVVIPCFNHANVLRRTLKHLQRQTVPAAEVAIIDDGSTDDPRSVAAYFEQTLPLHFVRFDANRGAPGARNEGFRLTTAPFVLFLDADAELVPDALASFRRALEEHPEADFAYANVRWGTKAMPARAFDPEELTRRNYIHTSSLLRRTAFPGFDESLKKFQDWDLWLTMAERGSRGVWIDRYLYRIEPRRTDGISTWLPGFLHLIPWPLFGWMPDEIRKYREAEAVIRRKHAI